MDERLVLDEDFFVRLRAEPEDREVLDRLDVLADGIEAALAATLETDRSAEGDDADRPSEEIPF